MRVFADGLDGVGDLVDAAEVGRPIAPLASVDGSQIAVLVRPFIPDVHSELLACAEQAYGADAGAVVGWDAVLEHVEKEVFVLVFAAPLVEVVSFGEERFLFFGGFGLHLGRIVLRGCVWGDGRWGDADRSRSACWRFVKPFGWLLTRF